MGQTTLAFLLGALLASVRGFPQQRTMPPGRPVLTSLQTAGANAAALQTQAGPVIAVGSQVTNLVRDPNGVQAASAGTQLQAGGGFGFGTSQVTSTAEREGALPVQATSGSTVVSTSRAALGSSQASALSTEPSNQPGVLGRVRASQAQATAISVQGGLTDRQRHVGRIEAGPEGTRVSLGGVVEQQISRAGQHASRLVDSARQLRQQAAGLTALTSQAVLNTPPAVQVTG